MLQDRLKSDLSCTPQKSSHGNSVLDRVRYCRFASCGAGYGPHGDGDPDVPVDVKQQVRPGEQEVSFISSGVLCLSSLVAYFHSSSFFRYFNILGWEFSGG